MGNMISMDGTASGAAGRKPRAGAKKSKISGLFAAEAGV